MLVLALALAAFIQPAAANGTTTDDRAVMSAVLDGFLNADRDPAFRPDATETNNPTPACSDVNRDTERRLLNGLECTSGFVPIDIASMQRNDTPLAIAGRLGGGGVILVAARCRKCFLTPW